MNKKEKKRFKVLDLFSPGKSNAVAYFTDLAALSYHIFIFFVFLWLKIYPMAYYNIFSISVFTYIYIRIKRAKSFVGLYLLAAFEVTLHQVLADYFLGSYAYFHFFIFVMGLLPFLVFKRNYKVSTIFSFTTSSVFIVFENLRWQPKYMIEPWITSSIRIINISFSSLMILFMVLIFTIAIYAYEKSLSESNQTLVNEIRMASVIQQSFFKQDTSSITNFELAYYSRAMAGVSGDVYDFYKTGDHLDGLGIFDISGHGISSGLITMLVKNIIHQEFYNHLDLDLWEIMNHINDRVIKEKGDVENYLTGTLVRFNKNKVEICSAGHPMPLLYHSKTGKCELLKQESSSSGAIGISGMPVFYHSEYFELEKGDELILYSDGVTDLQNENSEYMGIEGFIEVIEKFGINDARSQVKYISGDFDIFRGNQIAKDDLTFIIVKYPNHAVRK
ncbi:MAG: serine/threonine-protein phosphatase [Treponema sp.]|nr:serine/threonine-protein phosphatase [Treponema sp.]